MSKNKIRESSLDEKQGKELQYIDRTLKKAEKYIHAYAVLLYDQETICPSQAMEEEGETAAFLASKAYALQKGRHFTEAVEDLYRNCSMLGEFDRVLIKKLYKDIEKKRNITPAMNHSFDLVINKAYVDWLNAKKKADFKLFAPSLAKVRDVEVRKIALNDKALPVRYDNLLDDYETGITTEDLDGYFGQYKKRMLPLLKKIMGTGKKVRSDFMSREVTDEQQKKMAEYLLDLMGFDFGRGAFTTTEHPFTSGLARNDIRITTHYHPNMFYSSMYSVIHEGGHALFEMYQPAENYEHHIQYYKTMGQHESVSRFYENRIGRSRSFIHLIFPKVKEIFPQVVRDVSEQEFYEALNTVQPSLIRTEADEFTYTFHIIIRYEIEKLIMDGEVSTDELPEIWNRKYMEYLGVRPENDRDGILQDMHWASGFGYFPAYALGNMYNAMYYNAMDSEINIEKQLAGGHIDAVNEWMREHVWMKADRTDPKQWIREITGRDFTPDDFMDYLEKKYSDIYGL